MVARTVKLAGVTLGLCLVIVGLWTPTASADDAFARITGVAQGTIQGDQPAILGIANSANTVQVFSTVFGLSNPVSTTPGVIGTSGRPAAHPIGMVKRFDRASPKLLRAAFIGEALTVEIVWYMVLAGVVKQTVTIKLDNAFITDISAAADLHSTSASGQEQVTLSYSRITMSTPIIDAKGVVTGTSTVCLDVVNNRPC
jgi:type VI secretion system Hcp family effector